MQPQQCWQCGSRTAKSQAIQRNHSEIQRNYSEITSHAYETRTGVKYSKHSNASLAATMSHTLVLTADSICTMLYDAMPYGEQPTRMPHMQLCLDDMLLWLLTVRMATLAGTLRP
jgi:hypothetical protein